MSLFSTFSQMTWIAKRQLRSWRGLTDTRGWKWAVARSTRQRVIRVGQAQGERGDAYSMMAKEKVDSTHGDAVGVLLSDALGLSLALLERVLVLELAAHDDGGSVTTEIRWGLVFRLGSVRNVVDRWR